MASQRFGTMRSESSTRARLQLEPLEQRMLLSACAVFDNPTYYLGHNSCSTRR